MRNDDEPWRGEPREHNAVPDDDSREEREESLRAPEPASNMARVATVLWIVLTLLLMGAVVWWERDALHLPKHLFYIASISAALYAYAAHVNRTGDRTFD